MALTKLLSTVLALSVGCTVTAQHTIFHTQKHAGDLSQRWELDSATRHGVWLITAYRPVYVTGTRWTNSVNYQPTSATPGYTPPEKVPYNAVELKFQISFKSKVWQGIFGRHGDLWVGYTQKSHWQIYNQKLSRPFRETNYEPELILNFATNYKVLGMRGRMLGISFTHQSNGRQKPYSRSWNRIIAHAGFEKNDWSVYLRGWYRLKDTEDENPDITSYVGKGDGVFIYSPGKHQLTLSGGYNFKFNSAAKGNIKFDWMFPIKGNLKGLLQLSEGYGETLIDYNHKQATVGVGISLIEW